MNCRYVTISYAAERPVYIAEWSSAGSPAHLAFSSDTTLHIDAFVVVLKLSLRAEDHEQELFIRAIRKRLRIGAYMKQFVLIH